MQRQLVARFCSNLTSPPSLIPCGSLLTSTTFKNDEMLYIFQGKNIGKIQLGAVIALFLTVIKLHCRLLAYECQCM